MAAEMEREMIRECTLDGLAAATAQGRKGGRPPALDTAPLAVARSRRVHGKSITAIAKNLGVGRSTLYRALEGDDRQQKRLGRMSPGNLRLSQLSSNHRGHELAQIALHDCLPTETPFEHNLPRQAFSIQPSSK
ncbi:recombinase family protein [Streptosporangium canum]|uniref:helix-turn-helix domain-containing protein n=1 Tax=Streptosporangium canum TaxID=324952 RepID=UPI0034282012